MRKILEFRRLKLKLVYWAAVKGHSEVHPVKKVLENCWEHEYINLNSFGWKANEEAHQTGINNCAVCPTVVLPATPPWLFPMPVVDFQLLVSINDKNRQEPKETIVHKYLDLKYVSVIQLYTDGSKDPETGHTASAVYIPRFRNKTAKRTSNHISVYTTEMLAILLALQWVEVIKIPEVVICSDSFAALLSLKSGKSSTRQDILSDILQSLFRIHQTRTVISFVWVPAHIGVEGNEVVDQIAKQALKHSDIELIVPMSKLEIKGLIKGAVKDMWQKKKFKKWDSENKGRHLYNIQRIVGSERRSFGNRREDSIISHLRIGHSALNQSLLLLLLLLLFLCSFPSTSMLHTPSQ
ncbi:uncharacterized protein LOC127437749 [Myxocyprinus asiaticus]|uniref:uncharacterized protein LOC127437749 n=1 Tax=Myxocyprinus asiaticus TaxID=70543 RepID=UPI0022213430|nr:uncharacterized protein LOC127437749 [Myxocyprinus asiaticus]